MSSSLITFFLKAEASFSLLTSVMSRLSSSVSNHSDAGYRRVGVSELFQRCRSRVRTALAIDPSWLGLQACSSEYSPVLEGGHAAFDGVAQTSVCPVQGSLLDGQFPAGAVLDRDGESAVGTGVGQVGQDRQAEPDAGGDGPRSGRGCGRAEPGRSTGCRRADR